MNEENISRDAFDPLKKYDGEIYSCVILDGSNIITESLTKEDGSRGKKFVVHRLPAAMLAVQKLGWPTLVAMKRGTYNYVTTPPKPDWENYEPPNISDEGKQLLKELVDGLDVSLIDHKEDDLWLIKAAIDNNGWILTNDKFQKEIEKYMESGDDDIVQEIKNRRVWLNWASDKPLFTIPRKDHVTVFSESGLIESMLTSATTIDAVLRIDDVEKAMSLPLGRTFGRSEFKEIMDSDQLRKVSAAHLRIDRDGDELQITDIGSTNGTLVDGLKIASANAHSISSLQKHTIVVGTRSVVLTISPSD